MIRHFATKGNLEKRYIGRTEESVDRIDQYAKNFFSEEVFSLVCCSPKKRCLETAQYLFPDIEKKVWEDFRECDFGIFENLNYLDLEKDSDYQTWIESGGILPFPEGEAVSDFKIRTMKAFEEMLDYCFSMQYEKIAMVVHGGTIMSILEAFAEEKKEYFDWNVSNGNGYMVEVSDLDRKKVNVCGILSLPLL